MNFKRNIILGFMIGLIIIVALIWSGACFDEGGTNHNTPPTPLNDSQSHRLEIIEFSWPS